MPENMPDSCRMTALHSRLSPTNPARALFGALLVGMLGCSHEPAAPPAAPLASTFTTPSSGSGAELCRDCHAELVSSWAETPMARALGPVSSAELAGLAVLDSVASRSGFAYGILPTPEGEAFVLGETRGPSHSLGAELLFGIGAGVRDRSLAIQHGSSMFFAPLEVLTVPGGRALALAPGEMIAPGGRFGLPLSPECLGCHTDAPPALDFPVNLVPADFAPRGISCAGCHGSARELETHVTFQEADLAGEAPAGADPLLRLGQLERTLRLSVCAACHLQGDARIELQNQTLGHFEPGTDITRARAVFVGKLATDEVGFVSQTERLALSRCFLATELDCTTCHDPHRALSVERERVRAECTTCHTGPARVSCSRVPGTEPPGLSASAPGDHLVDCVTCHMPLTGVFDVAGVTVHDHWIRSSPVALLARTPDQIRFPEAPDGNWRRFVWPGGAAPPTLDDLGLWMTAFQSGGHTAQALELVDAEPGSGASGLAMYHHVRAVLLEAVERREEAATEYRTALSIDPALGASATNLGLLLALLGRPQEGLIVLDGLVRRFPKADGALRNRALVRLDLGDLLGFRTDLEAAFQLAPTAELARLLGQSFRDAAPERDMVKAKRYNQLAQELDPR